MFPLSLGLEKKKKRGWGGGGTKRAIRLQAALFAFIIRSGSPLAALSGLSILIAQRLTSQQATVFLFGEVLAILLPVF